MLSSQNVKFLQSVVTMRLKLNSLRHALAQYRQHPMYEKAVPWSHNNSSSFTKQNKQI